MAIPCLKACSSSTSLGQATLPSHLLPAHAVRLPTLAQGLSIDCCTGQGKKASLLFSAALQNRLTACFCHCNYTYGDLVFMQVCSDARPMHCSSGQDKIASLLFSTATRNRLTAALWHCKHTSGDLLSIQVCSDLTQCTAALVSAKQLPCFSVLLCKTGSQHACATAITPMEMWSSCRCAVLQHQCTAALVKATKLPCFSVLFCKTSSQHASATSITPIKICPLYRCAMM